MQVYMSEHSKEKGLCFPNEKILIKWEIEQVEKDDKNLIEFMADYIRNASYEGAKDLAKEILEESFINTVLEDFVYANDDNPITNFKLKYFKD